MSAEVKATGSPMPAEPSDGDRDSADITERSGKDKVNGDGKTENGRKATNAKDPSRPRRKKARRACFACQRAHLTCGMHSDPQCMYSRVNNANHAYGF